MKKGICILMTVFALFVCTGCDNPFHKGANTEESTTEEAVTQYNAAFVLGITNYNTVINTDAIDVLSELSGLPGSAYTLIECDGSPYVITVGEIPDFTDRGYTAKMLERIEASVQADIISQINLATPLTDEIDIASGIALAVRSIRANQNDSRKNVIVFYMSGLSTTGIIDFSEVSLSEIDIEASVENVVSAMNLDMSGIAAIFYCLGDTSGDQPDLSSSEVEVLRTFYEELFLEMHAESVSFMQDLPSSEGYDFAEQYVSIVETQENASVLSAAVLTDPDSAEEVEEALDNGDILSLSVSFLPDSTKLADPEEAAETLSSVIDYMAENSSFQLLIVGTTASVGSQEDCIQFSLKRAETIKNLLIKQGIDEERLHILGAGYSNEVLYVEDRDEDGSLNENSRLNRQVVLVDYDSDAAMQIINAK